MLPLEVALPMVLGANVGGGMIAVWLTRGMEIEARRIPLGNLILRGLAAVLGLALVETTELPIHYLGLTEGQQLVNFHLLFNLALVVIALPFVGLTERLTTILLPKPATTAGAENLQGSSSVLDRSTINSPELALACAKRELLRMGETVELMYRPVMNLIDSGNSEQIEQVRKMDEVIDRKHTDIKLFIAEVNRGHLSEDEARRGVELTDVAINLEHIGDIIAKTLMSLAEKKAKRKLTFSDEGWSELNSLHARVEANLQLALNVLVSGDGESARELVKEKEMMRKLERESHDRHLERLRSGKTESIETSNLHLETVRALKEINSLLATVAYPILIENGLLLESRLA
jgi:phosphate:Na+ symporter